MGKVDWKPFEYRVGTKLLGLAGMTIQVEFADGEDELLIVDDLYVRDGEIRAEAVNLSDTHGTYRLTGRTDSKELGFWRYEGPDQPELNDDEGWTEVASVVDISGYSTDRPEIPDEDETRDQDDADPDEPA